MAGLFAETFERCCETLEAAGAYSQSEPHTMVAMIEAAVAEAEVVLGWYDMADKLSENA